MERIEHCRLCIQERTVALLLTTAGSIGGLSVAAVLMYQAAWSALSIAVCAFKSGR